MEAEASPPDFTIPQSALQASATGSLPQYDPYRYISTYAWNARNGAGFFGLGGGPGKRTFTISGNGGPDARVAIRPGENRFGGTMRLLGEIGADRAHVYKNKVFVESAVPSFSLLGGQCSEPTCSIPTILEATAVLQYRTIMGKATSPAVTAWGLPWTTGTVSITATGGPFPTFFRRSGYDNRSENGLGTIQLVAPQVVKWEFPDRDSPWDRHTGVIGTLRIKFVPEPSGLVILSAGLGLLVVLYRSRRRE